MIRKVEDFLSVYGQMIEGTSKIFAQMDDKNINHPVGPGHRTLGQIAWHIVASTPEMMNRTGLGMSSVNHESMPPKTAAEMVAGYKAVADELVAAIKTGWTDETLLLTDDMYGQTWPRGMTLSVLLTHETHHRGQMTVLLRQAGAKVPGICGPSKEEWTQYGMDAPPY